MRFNSFFIFISMLIILFTSGCVYSSGVGVFRLGNGVVFNSLDFSPPAVKDNELSVLSLNFENTGSVKTGDVYVYLFGLSNDWTISEPNIVSPRNYMISDDSKIILNPLSPPYEVMKVPGDTVYISWPLRAPEELPKDMSFDFNAMVRVCYGYSTIANAKVVMYSKEEYLSKQIDGGIRQQPIVLEQTRGPIKLEITSLQPLVYKDNIVLKLNLYDVGGGTLIKNCSEIDDYTLDNELFKALQDFDLKIAGIDCDTGSLKADEVYFFKNQAGKTSASFTMECPISSGGAVPMQVSDLILRFDYNYYIDAKTLVSVEGTKAY
ncbi:MAG: hypothetical protein K0B02_00245 [DPANN group archaeon]|nr:hypothetical protein [DPANN group archaeon]